MKHNQDADGELTGHEPELGGELSRRPKRKERTMALAKVESKPTTPTIDVEREVNYARVIWRDVVLATLRERGLLREGGPLPQTRAVVLPDRVIFVLDMSNLGGVRLEQWQHPDLLKQLRTASGGCRVVMTAKGGLALQIGRKPARALPPPAPLPRRATLNLSRRPRPPYSIGVGVGREGPIWMPLGSMGHVMVGGITGSGKSSFLRALAYQLINLPRSQPVVLYLADRKRETFKALELYNVPQLEGRKVAKTPAETVDLLRMAAAEMGRRQRLFDAETRHLPDTLEEYNRIPGVERLPRVVVIVDEVTVLVEEGGGKGGEIHRLLLILAAQGRSAGVNLVLGGQDFKADTLNTALTRQLYTRIAFLAGSAHESRVVIGVDGAERLRGEGHGLLRQGARVREFQGFYVEKETLVARCAAIGTPPQAGPVLSTLEVKLIAHALAHQGGAFSQGALFAAFREDRVTRQVITNISDRLLAQGLLVEEQRDGDRVAKRWVTPELKALVRAQEA